MQPLTVVFIDINGFKAINDERGHAAGDRMLVQIANILVGLLRSYDLVVRYGGDEFLCSLTGITVSDATQRLEGINVALADSPERGSVTIGAAELQPDDTLDDLIARADAALYERRQARETSRPAPDER